MAVSSTPEKISPRLSVSILTRDSADRIADRVADARAFADEIIVGVDADSSDATFEIASETADVVFRFRHQGQLAPARLLPLEFASGDWILSLDDDESIEQDFDAIRMELLTNEAVTHYFFPRKWIVSIEPCEYARTPPWFPDWQLRLFRNDAAIVWKPPRAHSGYRVQGTGFYEARTSILHFEPLWCGDEARTRKIALYRQAGGPEVVDAFYQRMDSLTGEVRARCVLPNRLSKLKNRVASPRIETHTRELRTANFPDWRAHLEAGEIPRVVFTDSPLVAEIRARNTGRVAWSFGSGSWPFLNLAFHLLDAEGNVILYDGPRFALPRSARPGESILFLATFTAPSQPGDYLLEWDMVSEGECWFGDRGSALLRTPLSVEIQTPQT